MSRAESRVAVILNTSINGQNTYLRSVERLDGDLRRGDEEKHSDEDACNIGHIDRAGHRRRAAEKIGV